MFWGLIMEPQKRYSQVIKKAFHISMASLDLSNSDDQPAQILCGYEGKNYLLCTLQKPDKLQCNLDLYFEEGRSVSFASNGKSHIHLTGYLTKDDGFESASDEEDVQEFEVQAKKNLRNRDDTTKEPSKKKMKLEDLLTEEEEESDDSDFNIEQLMEEQSDEESEEEDVEDASNEDVDLDAESMDEEEDDLDEEGEEAEEEDDGDDEPEKKNIVQNGLSKNSKKNKKEEQKSTPTKKNKQNKEKPHQLTPGPKMKKQEKSVPEDKKNKVKEEKKNKETPSPVPKKRTLSNGIIIEDLRIGQGDAATNGKFLHVYYEGRLKNNNKLFDKCVNGPGFGFRLGKGEVIKGWDIGVNGMKAGGKRRIVCPSQVAYGAKGSPPVIPPNSTLVFEVELKKIK